MPNRRFLCCAILLLITGRAVGAERPYSFAETPGMLPKDVVPQSYDVRIRPNFTALTTDGSERIEIDIRKPVNRIVLNAFQLKVTKASLDRDPPITLVVSHDTAKQTVALTSAKTLKPGIYHLSLEFSGRIIRAPEGLHYVQYDTPSGPKVLLTTQMEPVHARRLFPSWDEPAFRARFVLTAVVPAGHVVMSNMPIARETALENHLKEVTFAATPSMASYLVVLATGEFEELKDRAGGTELRVLTTEGKRTTAAYAMDVTKKVLGYYNDYFDDPYPLPKLDQVALPGSIPGAMENWGGITYNEARLLYDPAESSFQTKRRVFGIVAHEVAHQWFGNLVTMAWWDNLWLNEGFASWMSSKVSDRFNPDWGVWLRVHRETEDAMNKDARRITHPIQQSVRDEAQAVDAFDEIAYGKAQAFLRMLESYLGEETFRAGIRRYIASHRYSNTTSADLWAALEHASGKPIRAIAAGWTERPGFPLVHVSSLCADGRRRVQLRQQRFTLNDPTAAPLTWKIPIALADGMTAEKVVLLDGPTATVEYGGCSGMLRANAGNVGYYRVEYEATLFQALRANINQLPTADRLKLLSDAWALVEAGRKSSATYLDLISSLTHEKSLHVWNQILDVFALIDRLQQDRPGRAAFRAYARALLAPELKRVGWDGPPDEGVEATQLRSRLISVLGSFDDPEVLREAQSRFDRFIETGSLTPDLREPVLYTVGRNATPAIYDRLHTLAKEALRFEDKQLYYRAMQGARDPALAKQTLALSLTEEMPVIEAARNPAVIAAAGEHRVLVWDFVRQNFPALIKKTSFYGRNYYVPRIMDAFDDAPRADELEAFVKAQLPASAVAVAARTADAIRHRAALKKRELPEIDQWVRNKEHQR